MILADTSVRIGHFRTGDQQLTSLLNAAQVIAHPFIIGEIALGHLKGRTQILAGLAKLPGATVAGDDEVLAFVDRAKLAGSGIGYLDAHLLASVALTPGARLWTRDKKLSTVAARLGLQM